MSKKVSRLKPSPPALEQVQLQLFDGCGSLALQGEVEVELIVRRPLDGSCTGLTRGLFLVFPYTTSPGWYKLVSRTLLSLGRENK